MESRDLNSSADQNFDRTSLPSSFDCEYSARKNHEERDKTLVEAHYVGSTLSRESSRSRTPKNRWKAVLLEFGLEIPSTLYHSKQAGLWKTTLVHFGPLSGLSCMLLAVASLVASLGVLAGSDGQDMDSWSVPPVGTSIDRTAHSDLRHHVYTTW